MTENTNHKDPYTILAEEENKEGGKPESSPQEKTSTQAAQNNQDNQTAPVQSTKASVPDEQSFIDTIIKVIIDIIAKIFGQPSPTWGKNPTASVSKEKIEKQVAANKEKVWNKVTGWLGYIWNTMENVANSAIQKASTSIKKAQEQASNTANQAVNTAKEQAQSAANTAQDAVNTTKEQVQKSTSDMVDGAKKTATATKETAEVAHDAVKNDDNATK